MRYNTREASPCDKSGIDNVIFSLLRSLSLSNNSQTLGIERDDVDYIMETFRVWKQNDEKEFGEYRTKRVILEVFDEMRRAMEVGEAYRTRLVPPAADPGVAHVVKERMDVIVGGE